MRPEVESYLRSITSGHVKAPNQNNARSMARATEDLTSLLNGSLHLLMEISLNDQPITDGGRRNMAVVSQLDKRGEPLWVLDGETFKRDESSLDLPLRARIARAVLEGKTVAVPKRWTSPNYDSKLTPVIQGEDDMIVIGGGEYEGNFYLQVYDQESAQRAAAVPRPEGLEPGFWDKVADFFLRLFFSRSDVCRDWDEHYKLTNLHITTESPFVNEADFIFPGNSNKAELQPKESKPKEPKPKLEEMSPEQLRQELERMAERTAPASNTITKLSYEPKTAPEIRNLMLERVQGLAATDLLSKMKKAPDQDQFLRDNQQNIANMMFNIKGYVDHLCNDKYKNEIEVLGNPALDWSAKNRPGQRLSGFTMQGLSYFQDYCTANLGPKGPESGGVEPAKSGVDLSMAASASAPKILGGN